CNDTLSATYLAAIKDRMYCDRADSGRRRQAQGALWRMAYGLCTLLAPVLPHTSDEAFRSLWKAAADDQSRCVHLETFVTEFGVAPDMGWSKVMEALAAARVALERAKAEGIENPLDAGVVLPDPDWTLARFEAVDLADLLGVSRVNVDATATAARVMDLR